MPNPPIICARCKKEINVPAYILVTPAIVLQEFLNPIPPIFHCREHAENFTKQMTFCDNCWIEELKDHDVKINDIDAIRKQRAKEKLEEIIKEDK